MTLDGDTSHCDRPSVIQMANIILVNPDFLHRTILPNAERYSRILANLRYIVLDEAHVYRGVFGAHAAWVIRRLLQLCKVKFDRRPQLIYCSATIRNPLDHFYLITGRR